ncbi:pre-rRNA processing protein [Exophiala xenobiotica]|uniref:Pre-rRNA processing protein n=1 Tax=Lithohypha guttulata TaxID=1690604 RepID=A0ABR0KN82_9EURO|nr:pre-rRNA processing protein [Lithohypha guttulata]KAK5329263.1 pre-rRNA processing protein [Exophiala xenobiotica]
MSSFFTASESQRKRKRPENDRPGKPRKRQDVNGGTGRSTDRGRGRGRGGRIKTSDRARPPQRQQREQDEERDESISGSDTAQDEASAGSAGETEASSEEDETAAERRVRLAQRYLDRIKGEVDEAGFDAEDLDRDIIARRLKEDVDEVKGRQFRLIANTLDFENPDKITFRADTHSTTAVAVCKPYVYTVSKDKTLIKWQLQPPSEDARQRKGGVKRKPKQLAYVRGIKIKATSPQQHGHTGAILSLAASPDGNYVATGGADKKLIIWRASDLTPLKTFYTHRDGVTGLDFAPITSNQSGFGAQLFSASMDRSIKTYSLAGDDSLAYVETLFGHQDHVLAVSALSQDQCVSVGARDRSARLWKVVDETQLKFLGDSSRNDEYQTGSLDCVAAIPPQHFVTGSDSGALQLWSMHKKKSLFTIRKAHGVDDLPPLEEVTSESDPKVIAELKKSDKRRPTPRGITALIALPGTDIILSGSWDGWVRVWKVSDDKRSLAPFAILGKQDEDIQMNDTLNGTITVNGTTDDGEQTPVADHPHPNPTSAASTGPGPVRGIINSLAVFERRKETTNEFGGKKEGESEGLCVVAGTGKETRLGRWLNIKSGRNGAVVFEIPLKKEKENDTLV